MTVSNLILSMEEIPYIHETVHTSHIKHPRASRRPTPPCKVAAMIFCCYDRGFQILGPNSSSPVAYCHEKIAMGKIALNWKNWAMVLSWIVIIHRNTIIFRFLKFIDTTIPCCVPIRHFVTPASVLYSRLLPPNIEPFPFASIDNFIKFVGSPSLRVAHRIIFPSVETPARWCPVNFYFLLYC